MHVLHQLGVCYHTAFYFRLQCGKRYVTGHDSRVGRGYRLAPVPLFQPSLIANSGGIEWDCAGGRVWVKMKISIDVPPAKHSGGCSGITVPRLGFPGRHALYDHTGMYPAFHWCSSQHDIVLRATHNTKALIDEARCRGRATDHAAKGRN